MSVANSSAAVKDHNDAHSRLSARLSREFENLHALWFFAHHFRPGRKWMTDSERCALRHFWH